MSYFTDLINKIFGFTETTKTETTIVKPLLNMHKPKDLQIFHPNSMWNTQIEDGIKIHPDSSMIMEISRKYSKGYGINSNKWTVPVFFINGSDADYVKVNRDDGQSYYDLFNDYLTPYIDGIWSDPEADGHCCIVDLESLKAYDFSKLDITNSTASTFNIWDLKGWGIQVPFLGVHWYRQGSRASGCPLLAGLIFKDEIENGVIPHALACSLPNIMLGQKLVLPASRANESEYDLGHVIPYGTRIRLKQDFDISGLSVTTKIIAKCLQDYGAFVVDRAEAFSFYAQNLGSDNKEWMDLVGDTLNMDEIGFDKYEVIDFKDRIIKL